MNTNDFLFEILTEELPPKRLQLLSQTLTSTIETGLYNAELHFKSIQYFATPRRLAVLIKQLAELQPDQKTERRGPALNAAFDKDGNPTRAAIGFAKSCGTSIESLKKSINNDDKYLVFSKINLGRSVFELLPNIIKQALDKLPIKKPMRWNNHNETFVRPVHGIIMLYGKKIIPAELFNLKTNNKTQGHRFHCQKTLTIKSPDEYANTLKESGFVMADFDERKETIRKQIETIAKEIKSTVIIEEDLLNEVTALVEWPVALLAEYPEHFLKLPNEVIILSLKKHQKCFPVTNKSGELLPYFITISNIKSKDPKQVIKGNERVVNARLADAEFFYKTDLKSSLETHVESLKSVIFQTQLGSLFDKTKRIEKLSGRIAEQIRVDSVCAQRAGWLSKTDLMTQMVSEFPELQGVMGRYYAKHDGESYDIAAALDEQYMPRFAGDSLPKTQTGQTLSIADKIDTIIGIIGINKAPTGDKDPFALKRAALGIIRIIIEKELPLDLLNLLEQAKNLFSISLPNENVIEQSFTFIYERLKSWALEQKFSAKEFAAVMANGITQPVDFYRRLKAVKAFHQLKEAESLAVANKRVSHLLLKQPILIGQRPINEALLTEKAEIQLDKCIKGKTKIADDLYHSKNYIDLLTELASLRDPIDNFFDEVMVMVEDEKLRMNRLILLASLRDLFLKVADISLL